MAKTKDNTNSVSIKPIIFSGEMVRALLEGRKTQTRRVIKPLKKYPECNICRPDLAFFENQAWFHGEYETVGVMVDAPYSVGDLLWVRETLECANGEAVGYPSDCSWPPNTPWTWKKDTLSAMCMPRWASRITLRVTGIRAERLQDISEEDARAEGAHYHDGNPDEFGMCQRLVVQAKDEFRHIWEALYHKDSPKAWHRNPWVWVYEFEVIRKNVGEVP